MRTEKQEDVRAGRRRRRRRRRRRWWRQIGEGGGETEREGGREGNEKEDVSVVAVTTMRGISTTTQTSQSFNLVINQETISETKYQDTNTQDGFVTSGFWWDAVIRYELT